MNQRRLASSPPESPVRENKKIAAAVDFDDIEEGRAAPEAAILGSVFPGNPSTGPLYPPPQHDSHHADDKEAGTSVGIAAARFGTPTRNSRDDPNEDDSCLAQLKKIADCLRFKNGPHFQTLTNTNSPRGTLRPEEQQENETASMKMRNSQRKRIRKYVYIAQAALIAIVLGVYIGWRIIDYSRGSSMAPNATDSDSILTPTLATVFLRPLDDRNSTFNATDEVPSVIPSLAPSLNTIESNEEEHRKTSSNRKMISAVAAKKHSDNLVEFADSP